MGMSSSAIPEECVNGTSAYLTADAGPGDGGRVLSTVVGPRLYITSSPDCGGNADEESVAVVLGTGKTKGDPSGKMEDSSLSVCANEEMSADGFHTAGH